MGGKQCSNEEKTQIVKFARDNPSVSTREVALRFSKDEKTIRNWKKDPTHVRAKGSQSLLSGPQEAELVDCINRFADGMVPCPGRVILELVRGDYVVLLRLRLDDALLITGSVFCSVEELSVLMVRNHTVLL